MLTARVPWSHRIGRPTSLVLVAALMCLSASCSEKTEVLRVEPVANEPPTIVAQGPTWSATPIDLTVQAAPRPYVIVGDPNGLDDIALAVFSIDGAVIRRIVVRPDSVLPDPYCSLITWSDSINISNLLPSTLRPSVENCSMFRNGSSFTYTGFPYGFYYETCGAFPAFATASPYFGQPTRPCNGGNPLTRFGVYPPAIPAPVDVNVTFVDVEYQGLRVTVYDGAGQTATTTFPTLRLIYRAYGEKPSPP
jgi:hypothetical protein